MKKDNKKIIGVIVIILLLIGIYFFVSNFRSEKPSSVDNTELSFTAQAKTTVAGFMDQLQKEGEITFQTRTYSGMGIFIEGINGVKNNGEKNWIYYVNGQKAQIGISNFQINPGDVVSWKYESSY